MKRFCVPVGGVSERARAEAISYNNAAATEKFASSGNAIFNDAVNS
jgi:hypothetical protein